MKRTFLYTDDKSNKFWNIEENGNSLTVNYGKVGTDGQTQTKEFLSADECQKQANKLIVEKTKKGYVEQSENTEAAVSTVKEEKPVVSKKEKAIKTEDKAQTILTDTQERKGITLYFRSGSSDKVYQAEILPSEDKTGYIVNALWGRRGSTMQTAAKTANPVSLEKAQAIFDKLIAEKQAKGYSEGDEGTLYVGTDLAARVSGLLPQLLNVIDDDTLEKMLNDPEYCAQPKHDGERRMIKESQTGVNRKGLTVALPEHFIEIFANSIKGVADLDGEMEGDYYTTFDILSLNDEDLRKRPYAERLSILKTHVVPNNNKFLIVETAFTTEEKRALFKQLKETNQEGIVFKHLDAPYTHGRPNSGGTHLKYKFCASATVFVMAQNEGKRSVVMGIHNPEGEAYEVGSVTIPPNHSIPEVEQIIEVRYLYAYPQGALYQPIYAGPRNDMEKTDCVDTQLKYKATGKDL